MTNPCDAASFAASATLLPRARHTAIAAAIACFAIPALAADFDLGNDVKAKVNATITFGTSVRTESPDPAVYGTLSAARVGATPGQLSPNSGGNDLNFPKDQQVSTVLRGVADVEVSRKNLGLFARVRAWNDFELADGIRPYGNVPNGFAQNVPLSDNGFAPEARFSNLLLSDIYGFGTFNTGVGQTVDVRVGRTSLNWGNARFSTGGIGGINMTDFSEVFRPGSVIRDSKIPVGMLYANLTDAKGWGVDGFVQFETRHNVPLGCGTFYSQANYAPAGCGYASVLPIDDATALAAGKYPHRQTDVPISNDAEYGLSARYTAASINTEFKGYAANYHNRAGSIQVINPNGVPGAGGGYGLLGTTRLTDPNGLRYAMEYAPNIHLYGASFETKFDPATTAYGEVAYRPNQALNLNASDLLAAFLTRSPTSALNIAKGTNTNVPQGGTFDGYDRFAVTNVALGFSKVLQKTMGASNVALNAEIATSHVASLPDAGVLRYGRADDYGVAAINGVPCVDTTTAQKSCAHDGFITSNAWGYRLRAAAVYPNAMLGATLTPSVLFTHDVHGYSFDGGLLQDRKVLRPALRADWSGKYFAEVQYNRIMGGAYNILVDRDTVTLVAGVNF